MTISGNGKNKFEDIWQGILPGLEPLPPAVRNYELLHKQLAEEEPVSTESPPPQPPPSLPPPPSPSPAPVTVTIKGTPNCSAEPEIVFLKARREQESDILRFYQTLIKKCPRSMIQALIPLERAQKQALSRLTTVYFLKTGERGQPCTSCPYICSVPHAIRNLCNEEAGGYEEYTRAAAEYKGLRAVCEEIAQIKARSSRELEMLLSRVI